MEVVAAAGDPPPREALVAAQAVLAEGLAVAIPTDTVYGLAADPMRPGATEQLFVAKRRPREVVVPVLVADSEQALSLAAAVPPWATALIERFWPGALTVVLPRRPGLRADLGADEATIGLRCPAHAVARALCGLVGPLATTSANLHGSPALTTAQAVVEAFAGLVPLVLDGGPCAGLPSTVVDCTGGEPKLLREGGVPWDDVVATVAGA